MKGQEVVDCAQVFGRVEKTINNMKISVIGSKKTHKKSPVS